MIPRLEALRSIVRYSEVHADGAEWHSATADALNAIESQSHRFPPAWRHLQQSVRIAIGEASGAVAFADRTPPGTEVRLSVSCPTWTGYAEEYLTYALHRLRTWRDDLRPRHRRAAELLNFDAWLKRYDRDAGAHSASGCCDFRRVRA